MTDNDKYARVIDEEAFGKMDNGDWKNPFEYRRNIARAKASQIERDIVERCAKVAKSQATNMTGHAAELIYTTAEKIAGRIRSLAPEQPK